MTRLLQRLQRRVVVALTWLVLALAVAPAADAAPLRANAVLMSAALARGVAAPVRPAPAAPSLAARRSSDRAAAGASRHRASCDWARSAGLVRSARGARARRPSPVSEELLLPVLRAAG